MKVGIIPENLTGKELYNFIVKNEALIIHTKKSMVKEADSVVAARLYVDDKGAIVSKAEVETAAVNPSKLKVAVVINTTNYLDSHGDVHIPGIWKKSLNDNKGGFYLLKEHRRSFEDVIGEGLKGVTKLMAWAELGIALPGTTEALLFTGEIDKERNSFMFEQYQKGFVKKHSVGMRYVKFVTCINDDDYPVQKENWDKYIVQVANRKEAEDEGYFWAVLEAQVIEGSAVLFASNCMTPTLEVSAIEEAATKNEPSAGTQEEPVKEDFSGWLNNTQFIKL
jgi:hypothetical protein